MIDGEKRSRPTDAPFGRVPTVDRHQRRCSDVFFSAHVRRKRSFLREFSRASRFSLLRYFSSDAVSAFLGLFFPCIIRPVDTNFHQDFDELSNFAADSGDYVNGPVVRGDGECVGAVMKGRGGAGPERYATGGGGGGGGRRKKKGRVSRRRAEPERPHPQRPSRRTVPSPRVPNWNFGSTVCCTTPGGCRRSRWPRRWP